MFGRERRDVAMLVVEVDLTAQAGCERGQSRSGRSSRITLGNTGGQS